MSRQMVSSIYARKAAAAAKTAPKEMMLATAAPVASGTPAEVPLAPPDEAVEAGLEAVPVAEPLEGFAELAMGTLVLPAGGATEVIRVGTTTGTVPTAGTELATDAAELATEAAEEATGVSLVKES